MNTPTLGEQVLAMDASSLGVDFDGFANFDDDDFFNTSGVSDNELNDGQLFNLNTPAFQVTPAALEPRAPAVPAEPLVPATTTESQQESAAGKNAGHVARTAEPTSHAHKAYMPSGLIDDLLDPNASMFQQSTAEQKQRYPHANSRQGPPLQSPESVNTASTVHPGHVHFPALQTHAQGWHGDQSFAQALQSQNLGFAPSPSWDQNFAFFPQVYHQQAGLGYPPQHQLLAQQQFAMQAQSPTMSSRDCHLLMPGFQGSSHPSPQVLGNVTHGHGQFSRPKQQLQLQQGRAQHAGHQPAQFRGHFPAQYPGRLLSHSSFSPACTSPHPFDQHQPSSLCWWPPRVATSIATKTPNFPVHPPYQTHHEQTESVSGATKSSYPEPSIASSPVPAYGSPTTESVRLATELAADTAREESIPLGAAFDLNSPSQFLEDTDTAPAPLVEDMVSGRQVVRHAPSTSYGQPGGYIVTRPYRVTDAQGYSGAIDAIDQMEHRKVLTNRALRKKGDPRCDPSRVYTAQISRPFSWGPATTEGCPLFSYTREGKLSEGRSYTTEELRLYVGSGRAMMWLQQAPSQVASRLGEDDNKCRWAECPVARRVISSGWLRIAFDEMPALTTDGTKDPFKYAAIMHLWCFEQCFDPVQFFEDRRLRPEVRSLPKETSNAMAMNREGDRDIVREAFEPWFQKRLASFHADGPMTAPREHRDSLSYQLVDYHVNNQTSARSKARDSRNSMRPAEYAKTINVHMGDLAKFVRIGKESKAAARKARIQQLQTLQGEPRHKTLEKAPIQRDPESPSSGNDSTSTRLGEVASQPTSPEESDAHGTVGIASGEATTASKNPPDLLSSIEPQQNPPPMETHPEYLDPLANFLSREASSSAAAEAAIIAGEISAPWVTSSGPRFPISEARMLKRKRSQDESPGKERSAKVQNIDRSTLKRKRASSDKTTGGVAAKRLRTDSNATKDSAMLEAAEGDFTLQGVSPFRVAQDGSFTESNISSRNARAASAQAAAPSVPEQHSASVAEQPESRPPPHNARRRARQNLQANGKKGSAKA